ncbi:MAG: AMP-binding protein [Herpetosiphonaceae bacterium]|nr:AMP-binding protein [Herpetosiphonaceae bacterium]
MAAASSVVETFLAWSERTPAKHCFIFEGITLTYAQLAERVRLFAGALLAWGLAPSERVALFMDNSPEFLVAYLGTHLARGVVVLVNTQYRQVELRHILSDAGVRLCVIDPGLRPELDRIRSELPALARVVETGPELNDFARDTVLPLVPLPQSDDLAVIAYTSGTTGLSKGAMLLHRNLMSNITAIITAWEWAAQDHLLLCLPLFHVHGLMVGVHGTLVSGASMDLRRRFTAPEVYEVLLTEPITMFFGVPTMYTRLVQEAAQRAEKPPALRLYVSGSAPLSPPTFREFAELFGQPILERYGMTETLMNLTNPYHGERRPGTVGAPFPGQAARIVDLRTRELLPSENDGEIEVWGPHVFKGYWQQPEATTASFTADGWFRTGDVGRYSIDGYFTITGRAKELIISGGYNIYPREVEEVLQQCPGVAEVAVVGLPDPDLGEQVVAAVVRTDPLLTAEALIAFCREHLASYKKPRRVDFVDHLPRNALGKLLKQRVRDDLLRRS